MAIAYSKIALSIPKPLVAAADRIAKREYRTRSEVMREALREFVERRGAYGAPAPAEAGAMSDVERRVPDVPWDDEPFTPAERRRVARGLAAVKRGEFVTLEQLKSDLAKRKTRVDRRRRAENS